MLVDVGHSDSVVRVIDVDLRHADLSSAIDALIVAVVEMTQTFAIAWLITYPLKPWNMNKNWDGAGRRNFA